MIIRISWPSQPDEDSPCPLQYVRPLTAPEWQFLTRIAKGRCGRRRPTGRRWNGPVPCCSAMRGARGRDRDQHEVLGCVDYWLEFLTVTYSRGSKRPMTDWAQASLTATEPKRILGQIRYTSEIKNVNTTRQAGSRLPSGSASDPARRVPVLRADARCAFRCACPRCAVCRFCAALTTGLGSEPSRRDSLQAFQVARARPRWFCR